MSRFSTGSRRAAFITILSWISVRPIMGRMMPQSFARCKKMWLQPPQEKSRANSGARLFVRTTNLNLTEPLRSFCPGFNLAEGPVVIALRSQLVPIFGATAF